MRIRRNNETVYHGPPPPNLTVSTNEPGPSTVPQGPTLSPRNAVGAAPQGPAISPRNAAVGVQEMDMEQGLTIRKSDGWRGTESESDVESEESDYSDGDGDDEYYRIFPRLKPETEEAQNERNIATAQRLNLDPDADVNDNLDAILSRIGVDVSRLPTLEDVDTFNPEYIVCPYDSAEEDASGKSQKEIRRLKKMKMKKFFNKRVTLGKFKYVPNEFLDTKFDPYKLDENEMKKKKKKKKKSKKRKDNNEPQQSTSSAPPPKRRKMDPAEGRSVSPMPSMPDSPSRSPTPLDSSSSAPRRRLESLSEKFNIPEITKIMAQRVPVGAELDTKSLCIRLTKELRESGISQATFSESILRRSQGTLSDLLRNPKPWSMLKGGSETFERMMNWLKLDKEVREALCELSGEDAARVMGFHDAPSPQKHGTTKKCRLKFTDHQRRVLQAAFRDNQDPPIGEMQTLAEELRLDLSTIRNFFGNHKRRTRVKEAGHPNVEEEEEEEDPMED